MLYNFTISNDQTILLLELIVIYYKDDTQSYTNKKHNYIIFTISNDQTILLLELRVIYYEDDTPIYKIDIGDTLIYFVFTKSI